ncbi:DUF2510 domain-containing protein [Nocardioides halotolerans]|uniref:DUF2510 domain-containing protein n=1 Tax=Nocardioides halotolerans TaxID=433660 RepID=UPI0012FC82A3
MGRLPPPGWHRAADGSLRWWNGRQWTPHRHPSTSASAAPPGWYREAADRLRWWDGQQWTEYRHPIPHHPAAPPGWYRETADGLRWWDGRQWTNHRHQLASHAGSALTPVAGSEDEPSEPGRKRWVLGGIALLGLLAALSGSDDDDSPWKSNAWQGCCESCDSTDVVHLVYDCPEWIDRSTAPSWVEFHSGWGLDNRRCEDCGHEWTAY